MSGIVSFLEAGFSGAFTFFYQFSDSHGAALIFLSLTVSLLLLPLQAFSDKLRKKDEEEKSKFAGDLAALKKHYQGIQGFYYIQTLYRQHRYHPIKSLRSMSGLLIQIPFFLGAYQFLSQYDGFSSAGFLFIADLGGPDRLGGPINLLPLLMTGINLLTAGLFFSSKSSSEKRQLYLLSFLFLILFYSAPAALVFYWTMNNAFSFLRYALGGRKKRKEGTPAVPRVSLKAQMARIQAHPWTLPGVFFLLWTSLYLGYITVTTVASHMPFVGVGAKALDLMFLTAGLVFFYFLYDFILHYKSSVMSRILLVKMIVMGGVVLLLGTVHFFDDYRLDSPLYNLALGLEKIMISLHLEGKEAEGILLYLVPSLCALLSFYGTAVLVFLGRGRFQRKEKTNLSYGKGFFPSALTTLGMVLFYIPSNRGFLTLGSGILFFLLMEFFSLAAYSFFYVFFRRFLSRELISYAVPAFLAAYFLTPFFTAFFSQSGDNNLGVRMALLGAVGGIVFFLVKSRKKMLMVSMVAAFSLFSFSQLVVPVEGGVKIQGKADRIPPFLKDKKIKTSPDIYLLIYDGIPDRVTMESLGISFDREINFLEEKGFVEYPRTYSRQLASLLSLSEMLDLKTYDYSSTQATSGGSAVNDFLHSQGYKTHYVLEPYFFINSEFQGDLQFPKPKKNEGLGVLVQGIYKGAFKFDTKGFTRYSQEDFRAAKWSIMKEDSPYPKFLYTHTGPGHTQNFGECGPNELELFQGRLDESMDIMRQDVNNILTSHREAVIIVAGDHGPQLLGDCAYLEGYDLEDITKPLIDDRFGTFVAIKWPDSYQEDYPIQTNQDVFQALLSFLVKEDIFTENRLPREVEFRGHTFIKEGEFQPYIP